MAISFETFLTTVPEEHQAFVTKLHEQLIEQGCAINIKEAKSGYVVSYQWEKKTIMNWIFRKTGMLARIYGDNVGQYESVIGSLPADMQKKMTGSRDCKRLYDPSACISTCVMGLIYNFEGETYKKCRNDGMFFPMSDKTGPYIQDLICAELNARKEGA